MSGYTLDNYLSLREASTYLGVGRSRFESLLKKSLITFHICPTSNRKIFHIQELDRFLRNFNEVGNGNGL